MKPAYLSSSALEQFIASALREDIGSGDHSTMASVPEDVTTQAELKVKDSGVIAGLELAGLIFRHVDPLLHVSLLLADGQSCRAGESGFTVSGKARSILTCERVVLNCLQRMSGIATYTHKLCQQLVGTKAQLLDTRKTTPNFRLAEKWAVLIGGGINHRFGLFDRILLKDNHIDVAGGVKQALSRSASYLRQTRLALKVEIEARSLADVEAILETGGADTILLDNMGIGDLRNAVRIISGRALTEASGGITESNLRAVAETGVDYISVGALTHSVKSLDMSLKVI